MKFVIVALFKSTNFISCIRTPISKNVVGDSDEWQLSNGDYTTERNCGFYIWYAKRVSSSRSAKVILLYERPTGPDLT